MAWKPVSHFSLDLSAPLVPEKAREGGARLLEGVLKAAPAAARAVADVAALRTAYRFDAEIKALAKQLRLSWRNLYLANLAYDLMIAQLACSTMVVPTPAGPVVARNLDWWPENLLAQNTYRVSYKKNDETVFQSAAFPGLVGVVTGVSQRGFAVVLNAVLSKEKFCARGYPVLLLLRRVLEEADSYQQAVKMLTETVLPVGALFTVAGRSNEERVVIERTPRRAAQRGVALDEVLLTTNDYRLLQEEQAQGQTDNFTTACSRYAALEKFLKTDATPSTDRLLKILTNPAVRQGITAQHVVMRPATGEMEVFVPAHLLCAQ